MNKKKSKQMLKREKEKLKEKLREVEIAEAAANVIPPRKIEYDMIVSSFTNNLYTINDIAADGHCLYRAISKQIQRIYNTSTDDIVSSDNNDNNDGTIMTKITNGISNYQDMSKLFIFCLLLFPAKNTFFLFS